MSSIKVTDRRMFDEKGDLREEFRTATEASRPAEKPPTAEPPTAEAPTDSPDSEIGGSGGERLVSETAEATREPERRSDRSPLDEQDPDESDLLDPIDHQLEFVDLVSMLAEPVALYLGDLPLPDGRSAKDLKRARVHIDLLDVLKEKTRGNLSDEEGSLLDGLLYQLKMRFVQSRGGR